MPTKSLSKRLQDIRIEMLVPPQEAHCSWGGVVGKKTFYRPTWLACLYPTQKILWKFAWYFLYNPVSHSLKVMHDVASQILSVLILANIPCLLNLHLPMKHEKIKWHWHWHVATWQKFQKWKWHKLPMYELSDKRKPSIYLKIFTYIEIYHSSPSESPGSHTLSLWLPGFGC